LFGDFHGAQFRADACRHASADDQAGDDGATLFDDGNDEECGEQGFGAEADKLSRVSRERTTPVAAPANATRGSDFEPIRPVGARIPGLHTEAEDGSDQLEAKEAQISKPLEEADQKDIEAVGLICACL